MFGGFLDICRADASACLVGTTSKTSVQEALGVGLCTTRTEAHISINNEDAERKTTINQIVSDQMRIKGVLMRTATWR